MTDYDWEPEPESDPGDDEELPDELSDEDGGFGADLWDDDDSDDDDEM